MERSEEETDSEDIYIYMCDRQLQIGDWRQGYTQPCTKALSTTLLAGGKKNLHGSKLITYLPDFGR
jgi:hypothetical protein